MPEYGKGKAKPGALIQIKFKAKVNDVFNLAKNFTNRAIQALTSETKKSTNEL